MSARPIPDGVLRTWPHVDPASWEWLSEHRLRGNHPSKPGAVTLVVSVFGESIGQGLPAGYTPEQERDTYAQLFEHAARLAAHREACANGTPVARPDTEANFGVVGRCWWCGKWPSEHNPETPADSRPREAVDRPGADRPVAAGSGEADPAPQAPGAGSAEPPEWLSDREFGDTVRAHGEPVYWSLPDLEGGQR